MSKPILQSLLKTAPVPFGVFNSPKDELVFVNDIFKKQLGYSREELCLMTKSFFEEVLHPDDLGKTRKLKEDLMASREGEVIDIDLKMRKKEGSYMWYHCYCTVAERDDKGIPVLTTVIAKNNTEIFQLTKKLQDSFKKIEKMRFINSHDLRSPVANIIGITSLMDPSIFKSNSQHELFDYLVLAVQKLDKVIHKINEVE